MDPRMSSTVNEKLSSFRIQYLDTETSDVFTARIRRMTGGYIFTLCVSPHLDGGGVPGPGGGVPNPAMDGGGGSQVSDFLGGIPGLRFSGGGSSVSIKGKIFDTRFGLIHVQTGKKLFVEGPPPPPVKGKIFDTRFGLIHVQTGEKKILLRDPPPPNSKKLLWLRGGRYASCVHAGGLSCSFVLLLRLIFYGVIRQVGINIMIPLKQYSSINQENQKISFRLNKLDILPST